MQFAPRPRSSVISYMNEPNKTCSAMSLDSMSKKVDFFPSACCSQGNDLSAKLSSEFHQTNPTSIQILYSIIKKPGISPNRANVEFAEHNSQSPFNIESPTKCWFDTKRPSKILFRDKL
ncbi:hypothetical protein ACH5RR_001435 [Cinchona calisaya]|uniref:Uncharacterized protein n=1 Tax=Cinchona calisaya TaxID=153742 RepID=A0ABD3B4M4_9GENT